MEFGYVLDLVGAWTNGERIGCDSGWTLGCTVFVDECEEYGALEEGYVGVFVLSLIEPFFGVRFWFGLCVVWFVCAGLVWNGVERQKVRKRYM